MLINGKRCQMIVSVYSENNEGGEFLFDTPAALVNFLDKVAVDKRYTGYLYQIAVAVDGEYNGDIIVNNVPVENKVSMDDKLQMLRNIVVTSIDDWEVGNPFFPRVTVSVETENNTICKTSCGKELGDNTWWIEFLEEANDFLSSAEPENEKYKVWFNIGTPNTWDEEDIAKDSRRILVSENGIRAIDYSDIENIVLTSLDMFLSNLIQ